MDKKSKSVGIVGIGFYVPEKIITNFDLEKTLDTSDEWIYTRTGIKERRVVADNQFASDLAAESSLRALKNAGMKPEEVELIVVCTLSPDMFFPSTACIVQSKIGAINSACFDIEAACSGFNYGLCIAESFIKSGQYNNVLLIGTEVFSRILDWQDRSTCVLFGDGAGAVVLREVSNNSGILSHYLNADGTGTDLLNLPAGGSRLPASIETVNQRLHYLKMNGREIYKFATKMIPEAVKNSLNKAGLTEKDIDLLIPHQANIRIINTVAEKLKLPMEKVFINIHKYGNTSAASIPIALSEAISENRIKKNDIVVLTSFGAGLTWGASVIRW